MFSVSGSSLFHGIVLYYQKLIILRYQKMQSDFGETLPELFVQVFELRVNMKRFENNFSRGIFSINKTYPGYGCEKFPEEMQKRAVWGIDSSRL